MSKLQVFRMGVGGFEVEHIDMIEDIFVIVNNIYIGVSTVKLQTICTVIKFKDGTFKFSMADEFVGVYTEDELKQVIVKQMY